MCPCSAATTTTPRWRQPTWTRPSRRTRSRSPRDEAELSSASATLPAFVRARELMLAGMRSEALTEWQQAYPQPAGNRTAPGPASRHALAVVRRVDRHGHAAASLRRLLAALSPALRCGRQVRGVTVRAAHRTGLRRAAPGKPVSSGCHFICGRGRPAANPAGNGPAHSTTRATPRATARRSAQSGDQRPAGRTHLKELIDQFGGQIPLALAGYNAGPNAALRWLPERSLDTDVWIENIPFNETRNYVQRILWHSVVFSWLQSGEPQTTRHWLTEVSRSNSTGRAATVCQAPRPDAISSTPLMMNCTPMQMSMKPMMRATAFMPVAPRTLSSRVAARSTM